MADEAGSSAAAVQAGAPEDEDEIPAGVDLRLFATISSDLAEADTPGSAVLARHGVTPDAWMVASTVWTSRVAFDALGEERALASAYAEAFNARQDAYKPVPPMSPEDWAQLVVEMGRGPGTTPLAARGLGASDYLRLSRHWTRVMCGDRAMADRYAERFHALTAPTRG